MMDAQLWAIASVLVVQGKPLPDCKCGVGNETSAPFHVVGCVRAAAQLIQTELDELYGEK